MVDFGTESDPNNAAYPSKFPYIPGGSVNSSCTTICESVGDNDEHSELTHDDPTNNYGKSFEGNVYNTLNLFGNPYNVTQSENYTTEFQPNGLDEQQVYASSNYYNGPNEYNSRNPNSLNANDAGECNIKYQSNLNYQYDTGNHYNTQDVYNQSEGQFVSNDENYSLERYRNSVSGFSNESFANDNHINYNVYNLSQLPNNGTEHRPMTVPTGSLAMQNGYPETATVSTNYTYPMNGEYNNSNYNMSANDYDNYHYKNSISGVKYQRTDNRWIARWTTAEGKRACKSFSVNIYGFQQAKMLAIQARQKGVALSGRSFCNRERQHAMKSGVGIIGIRFDKTQARWVSSYYEGGKRKFRYFTVKDYGYEEAKRNAILWKSCHDERLVKRVKEGYGINYGVANKMGQNIAFPINYGPNENAGYIRNSLSSEGYLVPNEYNPSVNLADYALDGNQNGVNYPNMTHYQIKQNKYAGPDPNYAVENLAVKYEDGFVSKGLPEYPVNYVSTANFNEQVKQEEYEGDSARFSSEDCDDERSNPTDRAPALPELGNVRLDHDVDKDSVGNESTDTTAVSDSSELKMNGVNEVGVASDEKRVDDETGGEKSNRQNETPHVTYDRKRARWARTWTDSEGKKTTRYFPVSKYGYKGAKVVALSATLETGVA